MAPFQPAAPDCGNGSRDCRHRRAHAGRAVGDPLALASLALHPDLWNWQCGRNAPGELTALDSSAVGGAQRSFGISLRAGSSRLLQLCVRNLARTGYLAEAGVIPVA